MTNKYKPYTPTAQIGSHQDIKHERDEYCWFREKPQVGNVIVNAVYESKREDH